MKHQVLALRADLALFNVLEGNTDEAERTRVATDAYTAHQRIPLPSTPPDRAQESLLRHAMATLAGRNPRRLRPPPATVPSIGGAWRDEVRITACNGWISILRGGPLFPSRTAIAGLRRRQIEREGPDLESLARTAGLVAAKPAALGLIVLYHLIRAAEIAIQHLDRGEPSPDPHDLDTQMRFARRAAENATPLGLEFLVLCLDPAARLHIGSKDNAP